VTVSSPIRGNVGPVPAKVDTTGNSVAKSAEQGLVVWEESAELSGPRRRAWRKLPQLVLTRSVAVDSSFTNEQLLLVNQLNLCVEEDHSVRSHWVLMELLPGERRRDRPATFRGG
jgi:hypothetical protein